jgi:hypothetical protein
MTGPTTAPEPTPPGATGAPPPPDIGWGRAVAAAVVILVVGTLGCVYLPNLVVTGFDSLSPDTRSNLAAVVCVVVLVVLAWCLRRAQARGLI